MTSVERRFVASALGAMVGFAAAFYLHPMMWWLGAALGGVVAWVALDPISIFRATPIAAQASLRAAPHVARILLYVLRGSVILFMMFFGPALYIFSGIIALEYFYGPDRSTAPSILGLGLAFFTGFSFLANVFIVDLRYGPPERHSSLKRSVFLLSPFGHLYLLGLGIGKVPAAVKDIVIFLPTFFIALYILTHSRERVLIAMDAMLGTAFGYLVLLRMAHFEMLPALFVTSLAAGVLGIAHYKLSEAFFMPRLVSKNSS